MNKTDLIEAVSAKAGISRTEAQKAVNAALDAITEGLVSGCKVTLMGFGTFEVRAREAREGRNPRTGESIKIKASRAPAFKPGKDMKEAVSQKKGKK